MSVTSGAERYESRAYNVLAPGSLVTQCDGRL